LKHGIENCDTLKDAINAIHDLVILIRRSGKRTDFLEASCKEIGLAFRKAIINGETRWNSIEAMLRRFVYLLRAIENLKPVDMFPALDKRNDLNNKLKIAQSQVSLIEEVLPILTSVAQWVQILSAKSSPTCPLVRLACKRINHTLSVDLKAIIEDLYDLSDEDIRLGENLTVVQQSLLEQFEAYLGDHYSGYWLFKVAEFLDPRTYGLLSALEKAEVFQLVIPLTTTEENTSPFELKRLAEETDAAESVRTAKRRRGAKRVVASAGEEAPLTEDEELQLSLGHNPRELSKQSPLQAESAALLGALRRACEAGVDVLTFWPSVEELYPIWARIALRILPTMGASTDAERFFKVTKAVCADHRSTLKPDMVNICASLNVWLTDKYMYRDCKEASRKQKSNRFTSLNVNLEMLNLQDAGTLDSDDDSDDDDDDEEETDEE
jgi:hypothetical protein